MTAALIITLVLGSGVWLTRYQYVGQGSTVMRVNRWTGTAVVLVRGRWRRVAGELSAERVASPFSDTVALLSRMRRIADSVALDSMRRAADAHPYADIIGRRYSPDNPFLTDSERRAADDYDRILQGNPPREEDALDALGKKRGVKLP